MDGSLKSNKTPKWLGLIFLGIGIVFLVIASLIGYFQQEFIDNSRTTEGRVVQMVGRMKKAPVVRFSLPNGESITFQSSISSNPPRYAVEEKVTVRYDLENPADAAIVGWIEAWLLVSIMGGFGAVFTLIGAGLTLKQI